MAGVQVQVISAQDGSRATVATNRYGWYVHGALSPGRYRLELTAGGYQTFELEEIDLPVAGLVDLNLTLRPLNDVWEAGLARSVLPHGSRAVLAFFGPDLDASRLSRPLSTRAREGGFEPSASDVITTDLLRALPLAGRDAYTLVVAAAGVTADAGTARGLGVSANGQRPASSSFRLDGLDNNQDLLTGPLTGLPPEALAEYRLSTGIFTAEYGGTSGILANAIGRGPQAVWHGLGYFYASHESLNANSFRRNAEGLGRAEDREWQPGWSFGGPLTRSWFATTAGEISHRRTEEAPVEVLLPSRTVQLPANGAGRALLDRFPAPFPASDFPNGYVTLTPNTEPSRRFLLGRVDHAPADGRYRQFLRWSEAHYERPNFVWSPYPDFRSTLRQPNQAVLAAFTSQLRPGLAHDARFGWSGQRLGWDRPGAEIPTLTADDGTVLPGSPAFYAFDYRQQRFETNQLMSWAAGAHQWKAGGSLMWRRFQNVFGPGRDGRLRFSSFVGDFGRGEPTAVDLLVERAALPALEPLVEAHHFRQNSGNVFLQDSWRVSSRVMLHLGVRYEYFAAPRQAAGPMIRLLDGGQWKSAARLLPADGNNFAPRVGVSWRVNQRGQTFLRASYGVFYDRLYDNLWQNLTLNSLVMRSIRLAPGFGVSPALSAPGTYLARPGAFNQDFPEVLSFSEKLRTPYAHSYSLSLRQAVGGWQFEAIGRGALGRQLLTNDKLNRPGVKTLAELPPINWRANQGTSSYHALALVASHRGERFSTQVSYTWSQAIDVQSDVLAGDFFDPSFIRTDRSNTPRTAAFSEAGNPAGDRGRADFDQRHNVAGWVVASLPARLQIAALAAARSGFPYTVYVPARETSLINRRADLLLPDPAMNQPIGGGRQLLNPFAFAEPAAGQQGTLGRNALAGPGLFNLDLSLSRSFRLRTDSQRLVVRADAFNALNHSNLQAPINDFNSFDFGAARYGRDGASGFPALLPFRETGRRFQLMLQVYF